MHFELGEGFADPDPPSSCLIRFTDRADVSAAGGLPPAADDRGRDLLGAWGSPCSMSAGTIGRVVPLVAGGGGGCTVALARDEVAMMIGSSPVN